MWRGTATTAPEPPPFANRQSRSLSGLWGTFENGNIGALMRRVPSDLVISGMPIRRDKPKTPREPRTPRVAELLRKAIKWQADFY